MSKGDRTLPILKHRSRSGATRSHLLIPKKAITTFNDHTIAVL
ncbi:hypothetical protein [Cyanobacterium stanieri]|nr:hypothetical protein [Cyanobacterium stanieri]